MIMSLVKTCTYQLVTVEDHKSTSQRSRRILRPFCYMDAVGSHLYVADAVDGRDTLLADSKY